MLFDTSQTDLLLSTTRAVRRRLDLDRPVDPAVIRDCLRLAVQAPTASNSQTWRWIGTDFKAATRPPVESITYWDTWGDTR